MSQVEIKPDGILAGSASAAAKVSINKRTIGETSGG